MADNSSLTSDQKLDKILEMLQKIESTSSNTSSNPILKYEEKLKKEIKTYMLKNYNISFIDDKIEENMYDIFLDEIINIINKITLMQ